MDTKSGNCGESCENSGKVGHLMTPSSTNSENSSGCGVSDSDKITITVAPTTGGTFDLSVQKDIAIENLKKIISKRLKVPKERILLLHKERQLRDGNLIESSISDGSTLTLLPSVETGLLSQRPEQTVMQALESLNDSQVNDFLSGKAPLNLTMRLGDHMMLIQLQLSSVTPSSSRKPATRAQEQSSLINSQLDSLINKSRENLSLMNSELSAHEQATQVPTPSTSSCAPAEPSSSFTPDISIPNFSLINSQLDSLINKSRENLSLINSELNSLLNKNTETLSALKRKLTQDPEAGIKKVKPESGKDCQNSDPGPSTSKKPAKYSEIMKNTVGGSETPSKRSEILSQIMESVRRISQNTQEMTQAIEGKVCEGGGTLPCDVSCTCGRREKTDAQRSDSSATLDTKALAEASRNLTQTLKQLSSEVLTCRSETTDDTAAPGPSTPRRRPGTPGAIIESMQHHGKGVFSGTFSGTLNPALQDRYGRPKRDISTIIHILNDLLCATPHYRQRPTSISTAKASGFSETVTIKPTDVAVVEDESVDPAVENEATRGKLERLRMVMEQNRARRRARREGKPSWGTSDPPTEMETVEEMEGSGESAEMMEISPPEPVVA